MARYCYRFRAPAWAIALIVIVACLAPATASAQSARQKRPRLPDPQTTSTDHFLIHYTFSGDNAVSTDDADHNGTPDYVESLAAALEFSWQREVVDMGWAAPPGDGGLGGDDRLDVYLENDMVDDIAGYTESGSGLVGDNPNTPETETEAAFSYLSIDNDFAEVDPQQDGETPEEVMKATVAHEFNHVLQAGYDSADPQTWLYEATAVWMEGQVYPDITDRQYYLPDLLDHPERCLAARKMWYGSWLYMEYVAEQYGPDVVRSIWEHSRGVDGYQAIDDALTPFGTSLLATSRDFAVANLLRAYTDGGDFPTIHQGGQINDQGTFAPKELVQSLGANYIRLGGKDAVSISFAGKQGLSARVVGIRGDQADVFEFVDGKVEIDLGQYKDAYVVVHGDELATTERRCGASDYALTVGPAEGSPSAAAATWPAANFAPLSSSGSSTSQGPSNPHQPYRDNNSSSTGSSNIEPNAPQSPDDLKPGFDTIVPAPPDGYYFDYAYIMTKKDFGASATFYVPDADKSANYDYLNSHDQWLSVSESPTDFKTLQDWQDAIQYQPAADAKSINGVEVLVENSSSKKRSQLAATFIYHGLFIVVDGGSDDEVTSMVLALIQEDQGGITPNLQGGTQSGAPALDTATPAPTVFVPVDDNTPSLMILGITAVCGLGICLAGVGVVAVVFLVRGKRS